MPVAPADVAAAFLSKQLDAALVPEPWGALLEAQGNKVLGDEKSIWRGGKYPSAVVIVNTKFAQANPEIVKGFLRAHLQAVNFMVKSPVAAQAAISGELLKLTSQKVDARVLQRALKRTQITSDIDTDALKDYGQLSLAAGYTRTLPDFGALVDLSVLKSWAANNDAGRGAATGPAQPDAAVAVWACWSSWACGGSSPTC